MYTYIYSYIEGHSILSNDNYNNNNNKTIIKEDVEKNKKKGSIQEKATHIHIFLHTFTIEKRNNQSIHQYLFI